MAPETSSFSPPPPRTSADSPSSSRHRSQHPLEAPLTRSRSDAKPAQSRLFQRYRRRADVHLQAPRGRYCSCPVPKFPPNLDCRKLCSVRAIGEHSAPCSPEETATTWTPPPTHPTSSRSDCLKNLLPAHEIPISERYLRNRRNHHLCRAVGERQS